MFKLLIFLLPVSLILPGCRTSTSELAVDQSTTAEHHSDHDLSVTNRAFAEHLQWYCHELSNEALQNTRPECQTPLIQAICDQQRDRLDRSVADLLTYGKINAFNRYADIRAYAAYHMEAQFRKEARTCKLLPSSQLIPQKKKESIDPNLQAKSANNFWKSVIDDFNTRGDGSLTANKKQSDFSWLFDHIEQGMATEACHLAIDEALALVDHPELSNANSPLSCPNSFKAEQKHCLKTVAGQLCAEIRQTLAKATRSSQKFLSRTELELALNAGLSEACRVRNNAKVCQYLLHAVEMAMPELTEAANKVKCDQKTATSGCVISLWQEAKWRESEYFTPERTHLAHPLGEVSTWTRQCCHCQQAYYTSTEKLIGVHHSLLTHHQDRACSDYDSLQRQIFLDHFGPTTIHWQQCQSVTLISSHCNFDEKRPDESRWVFDPTTDTYLPLISPSQDHERSPPYLKMPVLSPNDIEDEAAISIP